ncbi:MAG TPA: L-rhamnose catabolism isomerase [Gammaproteobacteria bacterium]|nr:L-rhamnose catabolism isomerase [Gammaproteobacteria bacterium]
MSEADVFDAGAIARGNEAVENDHAADYAALKDRLGRHGIDVDAVTEKVRGFKVALPSWGVGTGGTRFGRFPQPGEPRNVFEKFQDASVVNRLTAATPRVSTHFPWDNVDDLGELAGWAEALGLGFDAVNSNTFQDQPGQTLSYKFGSLTHTDPAVRRQAIDLNLQCIDKGKRLGAKALTVWIGDGANFPGQQNFIDAFDRYLDSMREIYRALPDDWRVFIEHKPFEPAFYATVIADWGSSLMAATELGPKARCLVDLGHHAPTTNIEMIVARLIGARRLGGFHFNDSKYGDDDLDSGAIAPFQLFLIFNELVEAERRGIPDFDPAHMLDQSHNVTDPVESLVASATQLQRAYAQAQIVDREALAGYQNDNDALMAHRTVKSAFETDVEPILAEARRREGAAIAPIDTYRASGYRRERAEARPQKLTGAAGIV